MVLDLFTNRAAAAIGRNGRRLRSAEQLSKRGRASQRHATRDSEAAGLDTADDVAAAVGRCGSPEDDGKLFADCVVQVQCSLKAYAGSPSTLHTLASYYTRVDPYIEHRPFCVSLSYATFLFHMQMARVSVQDVELYVRLIACALSQLSDDEKLRHPFVQQVLRDRVFGLPSPTCRGAAHCVVLLSPQHYRAFAGMVCGLLELDVVPLDIVYQLHDKLQTYCGATSPLVAHRALALLVQTVGEVRLDEQIMALQHVLKSRPATINLDFLLACYERLKRGVLDPAGGPRFGRAISIHCSELFLRFRSPVRRAYVERFLYPSLCHPDMADFLAIPATRKHLSRELLALCSPGMSTTNPFYLCMCALMQRSFDHEVDGALETMVLINSQMPHAAYFLAALAIDSHMAVSMFAKVVITLTRGAGLAMAGRDAPDEVAAAINKSWTSVYNILFTLREVVRACAITASRRATEMLMALRVAVPLTSIEALGKLSSEAFKERADITVDPQLLCAELAMVLHHEHVVEALRSAVDYFRDVTGQCPYCGLQRNASLLCHVNGTVHVSGLTSVSRVLSALSECAGAQVLQEQLVQLLRDSSTQMDGAVHYLLYHIVANAGQHRGALFAAVEPYVRSTLLTLVSADRVGGGGAARELMSSECRANVLMLHVKLVTLLSSSIDPSYVSSILKVFAELKLRSNHDALALWYMGNVLLRGCRGNLELLPTDPQESNYCVDFPGCAPASSTSADNAQLVLKLLDRAHHFSAETRKLVGCCVCRLIQDFNLQTPNIVSALLSSPGFVPVGLDSLSQYALPVGAGSAFWSFFIRQMKASAPARTAFMAALAKCMARRFRVATPAHALAPLLSEGRAGGGETTSHLFAVMMYEAMKRSPALARVVLFMVSHWMKQADHAPGKFVCLVYICTQLVTVVADRGAGPARVELEAETALDQKHFCDSVKRAAGLLRTQQPRLEKLAPIVRRDNTEFFYLLRRLQRVVRRTLALSNGEPAAPDLEAEEAMEWGNSLCDEDDGAAGRHQESPQSMAASPPAAQPPADALVMALSDLQKAVDNSIFDDVSSGSGAAPYDDNERGYVTNYGDAPTRPPSPVTADDPRSRDGASTLGTRLKAVLADDAPALLAPPPEGNPHGGDSNGGVGGERHPPHPSQRRGVPVADLGEPSSAYNASVAPSGEPPAVRTRDVAVSVSFQRSVGTSPLQPPCSDAGGSPCSRVAAERRDGGGSAFAWRESDAEVEVQGDITPIAVRHKPRLQAADASADEQHSAVVLPSGMVLDYLRTHQAVDSLRHELEQLEQGLAAQQMNDYAQQERQKPLPLPLPHPQLASCCPRFLEQQVTVEGCANNYGRPHHTAHPEPGNTVVAPVKMLATAQVRRTGLPRAETAGSQHPRPLVDDVVDGEGLVTAVSEDALLAKRARMEQEQQPPLPGTCNSVHGMNFFLQPSQQTVESALQDLQHIQRQGGAMSTLVQQQQQSFAAAGVAGTRAAVPQRRLQEDVENVDPATPHPCTLGMECPLPTTPYGQVMIPACLVEQRNDTTVEELHQVMGARNPNVAQLRHSTHGKRRVMQGDDSGSCGEAWWAEMSSAPMPLYATDPQYSMELF